MGSSETLCERHPSGTASSRRRLSRSDKPAAPDPPRQSPVRLRAGARPPSDRAPRVARSETDVVYGAETCFRFGACTRIHRDRRDSLCPAGVAGDIGIVTARVLGGGVVLDILRLACSLAPPGLVSSTRFRSWHPAATWREPRPLPIRAALSFPGITGEARVRVTTEYIPRLSATELARP